MNIEGLTILLRRYGIDAKRVLVDGADETGYFYMEVDKDGRPVATNIAGAFEILRSRREWPDGVWPKVARLLSGASLEDVDG